MREITGLTMRPFYTNKAQDNASHRPGYNRRSTGLLRRLRRVWYHASDSLGTFLWVVVGLMFAVLTVMAFVGVESWFR